MTEGGGKYFSVGRRGEKQFDIPVSSLTITLLTDVLIITDRNDQILHNTKTKPEDVCRWPGENVKSMKINVMIKRNTLALALG